MQKNADYLYHCKIIKIVFAFSDSAIQSILRELSILSYKTIIDTLLEGFLQFKMSFMRGTFHFRKIIKTEPKKQCHIIHYKYA